MNIFGIELSTWAEFGIVIATLILASITVLTIREMHLQQKKERLHKEMTLLVGQLRSCQDSDYLFGLTREHRPGRYSSKDMFSWRVYYGFWDNIMINMYLGDPDLLRALENYIVAKEDYWNRVGNSWPPAFENTAEGKQKINRVETVRKALRIETDRRYGNLKKEIDKLEVRPWWQFWK